MRHFVLWEKLAEKMASTNFSSALDKLALANLHSKYQYYQQSICLKVKIRLRLPRFRTCSHLTSSQTSRIIFSHLNFHFPWVQNLSFRIWGLNKVVPYNSACHTTCHIKFSWQLLTWFKSTHLILRENNKLLHNCTHLTRQ